MIVVSLWRNEQIIDDQQICPHLLILQNLHLWALNGRPSLVLRGDIDCTVPMNTAAEPQFKAKFSFADGSTAELRSQASSEVCGKGAVVELTGTADFPTFKQIQSVVLISSVSAKGISLTWYNAHP